VRTRKEVPALERAICVHDSDSWAPHHLQPGLSTRSSRLLARRFLETAQSVERGEARGSGPSNAIVLAA